MKQIHQFLLCTCLSTWLLMPYSAAAIDDPHRLARAEIAFTQGLVAFEESSYSDSELLVEAKEWFQRALLSDAQHGSARYWLGLVHLLEGNGSAAADEIKRSLDAAKLPRTQSWRSCLHLALAHHLAGKPGEAHRAIKRAFRLQRRQATSPTVCPGTAELTDQAVEKLLQDDVPSLVTSFLTSFPACDLGPFWPPPKEPTWEGSISLLTGWDSNPNILDEELILDSPDGEVVSGRDADQLTNLGLQLARYFRRGSWNLGLTHQLRADIYGDLSYLSRTQNRSTFHLARGPDQLQYLSGPLGATRVPYGYSEMSWLFQIGYQITHLDGETYRQGFEAAATWVWQPLRASAIRVELLVRDRKFAPDRSRDRSTRLWYFDASQYIFIRLRNRYLRVGARFGSHDGERAYNRALVEPYIELSLPIGKRLDLRLSGSLNQEEYDDPESNIFVASSDSRPRDDATLSGHLHLSWTLTRNLRLIGSLYFADRDSEQELPVGIPGLGYRRTRTTVGLHWSLR